MKKNRQKQQPSKPEAAPSAVLFHPLLLVPFLVWGYFVLANYLKPYPAGFNFGGMFFFGAENVSLMNIFNLLSYVPHFLFAAFLFVSAFGLGRFALNVFKISSLEEGEYIYSTALGLCLIIYSTLLIGSLGLLYKPLVLILPVFGAVYAFAKASVNKPVLSFSVSKIPFLMKILLLIVAAELVFTLIGSLANETFYDSLKYHIGVPHYWILNHKISAIPNFEYSYYPVNIHLLYMLGLMFGNDITAKLIHYAFGILSAAAIYQWSRKRFSNETGVMAVLIFFSVPFVYMVMWKTAIELGLAFFETMAVLSFINFLTEAPEKKTRWAVLSALFCGTAIGGKYLSVYSLIAIVAAAAVYFIAKKQVSKRNLYYAGLIVFVSLFLVAPYLVRNQILTGKFAYPYNIGFKSEITASLRDVQVDFNDPPKPDRTIRNFLTLPWSLTMGAKTQEPLSGALLLLFVPFIFLFRNSDEKIKSLLIYCGVYYFLWFYVRTYFRYIVPLMPALSIAIAYFLTVPKLSKYFKFIALSALTVLFVSILNLLVMTEAATMDPLRVVLGLESKKYYLSTSRPSYPTPYYQSLEWANLNLPDGSRIMFLGECRGYYSANKFITHTLSDYNPLVVMASRANNGDELYKLLKAEGVTHLLFNVPEARRIASYDMFHFEPKDLKVVLQFWDKYVAQLYAEPGDMAAPQQGIHSMKKQQAQWWSQYSAMPQNSVYIYRIMDSEEASKPHRPPLNFFLDKEIYSADRWKRFEGLIRNGG